MTDSTLTPVTAGSTPAEDHSIAWARSIPFFVVHLVPLAAFVTGVSLGDWILMLALFFGLWCLRAGQLVLGRRAQASVRLPEFRSIQAFARETRLWVAAFLALWLLG